MSATSSIDRERLLAVLFDLFPWSRVYRDRPVRDYAAALFETRSDLTCSTRLHARHVMCRWIRQKAIKVGFDTARADRITEEIDSFPVLQTGPHLHLLIEPDAFYTHIFSLLGLRARNATSYVSYACSTVKFVEKSRKGPGWLRLDGQAVNVFGLSRREMIPYSVLAQNRDYEFRLQPADGYTSHSPSIQKLRELLPEESFSSGAAAIKAANQRLWLEFFDPRVDFLQLDDDDVIDLVVSHLADPNSWLHSKFMGDATLPVTMLRAVDRLASTPWRNWLKNSTHYFWGCDNGRIYPMLLEAGILKPADGVGEGIAFTPEGLMSGLTAKRIVPNLFLVFIVTAILPGVRVLGGSRHTVYYPLMRYAFCSGLVDSERDDDLLRSLLHDKRAGAWGHRVISDEVEPFALLNSRNGEVPSLLSRYGAKTFDRSCGPLESFIDDPLWVELAAALANGTASTMRGPWAFA